MPAPVPHTIWIEPMFGGSLITFENYLGQRQSLHRQRRVISLVTRISKIRGNVLGAHHRYPCGSALMLYTAERVVVRRLQEVENDTLGLA